MQDFDTEESARQQLRAQRRAKLREKRRRERRRKQILVLSCMGLGVIILLTAGGRLIAARNHRGTEHSSDRGNSEYRFRCHGTGGRCGENRIGRFRHI